MTIQPDAALTLRLSLSDRRIGAVALSSSRAVLAGRVLCGRGMGEALTLLPLLFSLCGTAQYQAGLAACEAACAIVPGAERRRARRMLLLAEGVTEHATQILRDWPLLLGETPRLETARDLRRLLGGLRPALADPTLIAAILSAAEALLREALFGGDAEDILADREALIRWSRSGATIAARLIAHVGGDLAGFGAADVALMAIDPAELAPLLAADRQDAFLAAPHWRGAPMETGPLARRRAHPLVATLLADHGTGLLPRFTARLVEIDAALREMHDLAAQPLDGAAPALAAATGSGFGWVEAARGLLAHRVELTGDKVTRYQILAPTEWNFHPQGPLARGLTGAAAQDAADAEHKARLLVAALDPCVACLLEVTANA